MAKRPLLTATVFFLSGVLLNINQVNIAHIIVLCGLLLLGWLAFYRKHLLLYALMIVFLLTGAMRMDAAENKRIEIVNHYNAVSAYMEMTATDFSDNGQVIVNFRDNGRTYKAYLRAKNNIQMQPGDIVCGEVAFSAPMTSKTGRNSFSSYLASRRVYIVATSENIHILGQYTGGVMGKVYSFRRYMNKLGEKYFNGTAQAFYNAMVFGDKRLITEEMTQMLQGSGVNHIAVVSGMHLSVIIAAVMYLIHSALGRSRAASAAAAIAALLVMLVTGAGASVTRAFVMCVLYHLSQILYRENDSLTSLAFAVLVMMAVNPYLVFNVGFILSVLSVLGIFLFSKRLSEDFQPFIPKGVNGVISVSIAASLTVSTAVIFFFGIITPYAVLSNLLVLTIATLFVVIGIILPIADIIGMGGFLAGIMKMLSDAMFLICSAVSKLPAAVVPMKKPDAVFLAVWIFAAFMIYKHPISKKARTRAAFIFAIVLVSAAFLNRGDAPQVNFLTYGGKTMTAVFGENGEAILIDCPDSYDATSLEEDMQTSFRWGILTADDAKNMLNAYHGGKLDAVIAPEGLFTKERQEELMAEAAEKRLRLKFLPDGQRISLGKIKAEFFPVGEDKRALRLDFNGKSLVTLQGITGKDIEKLCAEKTKIKCDYLKIPFSVLKEGTDLSMLTNGKILTREKKLYIQ